MAACKSATPPAEENLPTAEMAATVWARVHAEPCAHDETSLSVIIIRGSGVESSSGIDETCHGACDSWVSDEWLREGQ